RRLRPAELPAHHHRRRGLLPARRPCHRPLHGRAFGVAGMSGSATAGAAAAAPAEPPAEPPFRHVALIGLGLIASSMAHALRLVWPELRITGFARSSETRAEARRIGFAEVMDSAAEAVTGADLVVLAVPVGAMGPVAKSIAPYLRPGCVVTDVGSV